MEGWIIWIIIVVGWAILSSFSGDSSSDVQQSVSENAFTVNVKKGLPPAKSGLKIECYNVEMAGMISHPTDDQVKIILIIQDITDNNDENDAGAPILSAHEAFAEQGGRVLSVQRLYDSGPTHYFRDWVLFIPVPVDFIIPPHKGKRKLKFLLCVADSNTTTDRGAIDDTTKLHHFSSKIINFNFKEPGYMDELVNKDKVEDLTIKLGMSMAAADGHLEQRELNVIKGWVKNLTILLEEDKAEERKKHFSKFVKSAYTAAKGKKISLSNLVKEFNDIASKPQKYTAMQLLLDISGADGTLSKEEDAFINKIAKTTGVNLSTFKEMKNKVIATVDNIDLSEKPSEESFGITEDMDDKQKCKVLRKEFTKWNGQTNHNNIKKRKRAKEMVKIIANLRKQYNC